jgi:hypothetical protein
MRFASVENAVVCLPGWGTCAFVQGAEGLFGRKILEFVVTGPSPSALGDPATIGTPGLAAPVQDVRGRPHTSLIVTEIKFGKKELADGPLVQHQVVDLSSHLVNLQKGTHFVVPRCDVYPRCRRNCSYQSLPFQSISTGFNTRRKHGN